MAFLLEFKFFKDRVVSPGPSITLRSVEFLSWRLLELSGSS